MNIPLAEIKNLYCRIPGGKEILKDICLDIDHDSFTVIAGPNGSGKTMLMRHLNGILLPDSGDVLVEGISVRKDSLHARRRIGLVFQNSDSQIVAQTVRDDISFGPENIGMPDREIDRAVDTVIEELELGHIEFNPPHRLSGGEKKKTAIAGVLVMEPELIVFDEPFAGLDYAGVRMILRKMLELRAAGRSVIVITHDLEKVLALADRLVVMNDGLIAGCGAPDAMLETAASNGLRVPEQLPPEKMCWLDDRL